MACELYQAEELTSFASTSVPFTFTKEIVGGVVSTVMLLVSAVVAVLPELSVTVAEIV